MSERAYTATCPCCHNEYDFRTRREMERRQVELATCGTPALTNAARIAVELTASYGASCAAAHLLSHSELERAAQALASWQARPGFTWEGAPMDWESVCAQLAHKVQTTSRPNWDRIVAQLLRKEGTS